MSESVKRYTIRQDSIEFELIEIDLSDIYDFAPQVTACELLKTLAGVYETLKNILDSSQIIIETSPDAGVEVWGSLDKDVAYALAWVVKLVPYMSISEALKFIRRFEDFDEDKVMGLLKRTKQMLRLWDGYESCYALVMEK